MAYGGTACNDAGRFALSYLGGPSRRGGMAGRVVCFRAWAGAVAGAAHERERCADGEVDERKSAIGLLELKHTMRVPKRDPGGQHPFGPSEQDIAEAELALKGIRHLLKTTDLRRCRSINARR